MPCDLCELPPDRLLTEVEACWLQLERRLQTADDEVPHMHLSCRGAAAITAARLPPACP